MRKATVSKVLFIVILFLSVIACGVATPAPTPNVLDTVVASTLTSMPVAPTQVPPTSIPATETPGVAPIPNTVGVIYVYTQSENVNLRVNPGRLFKVSRVLAKGTRLQLLGYAPSRLWLNVVNDEGVVGWVGADFVQSGFDGPPPPVITPKDVLTITGTVRDGTGNPVSGVGFAATQNGQRDDGTTDETGTFYIFLPTKLAGKWDVGYVSLACPSKYMDANCKCTSGACKPDPEAISVNVPLSAPLNFAWK
jgi:hypothetical protein